MKWLKSKAVYLLIVFVALAAGIGVFFYTDNLLKPVGDTTAAQGEELSLGDQENNTGEIRQFSNPLNGYPLRKLPDRRPAAVIMDNQSQARPQTGLGDADLVYEFPVEGGITRFLALYYQRVPWKLGPVRSARPYIISFARQWKADLIHVGGSPEALAELKDYPYHVEALDSSLFQRSRDREKPHNLYFNLSSLEQQIGKLAPGEKLPEVFMWGGEPAGGAASEVNIFYTQKDSKVSFRFDKEKDNYLRFQGGAPQIDAATGLQLRAENIIIQQVDTKVVDGEGRLEIKLFGKGKAWVISRGKAVNAVWQRDNPDLPAKFLDDEGREIPLKTGQTWIEIVPSDAKIDIS